MDNLLHRLQGNQRRGSKARCHWLTHGNPAIVAGRLNNLAEPWGSVSADDRWMPEGFEKVEEAQLHRAHRLLPLRDREALSNWWLEVRSERSQTPNWDIASTCTVDGQEGLLLVEAKAHTQELKVKDVVEASHSNGVRIAECIEEANAELADQTGLRWALTHEQRYQMANRFAWSLKLTKLGYPVILVYLGFLKAEEMRKGRKQTPIESHAEWNSLVEAHSEPLFPVDVWGRQWVIHGRPFVPRICSIEMSYEEPMKDEYTFGGPG